MAGSLNRVQLIGNLGRDPEVRSLNNGGRVCTFSVATNESWKDKNTGEKQERVEWHNIVVFHDGLIGVIEKYLKKGSKCYIEGQMRTRKWQDTSGADRWSTEVVIAQFGGQLILLGDGGGRQAPSPDDYGKPSHTQSKPQQSLAEELDDEIPF